MPIYFSIHFNDLGLFAVLEVNYTTCVHAQLTEIVGFLREVAVTDHYGYNQIFF